MKERPILFQGAMVRALLAGTKTQTRRLVKPQPDFDTARAMLGGDTSTAACVYDHAFGGIGLRRGNGTGFVQPNIRCPYGQTGDRLWVREAHWWFKDEHDPVTGYFPPKLTTEDVEYRADGERPGRVWRPSIHMPRWASRILLEVTEVRVQRLWEISEADAQAEGWDGTVLGYAKLWESINGPGSWDANPWVWAVSFKQVTA